MSEAGLAYVELDEEGVNKAFRQDVLEGLAQRQKAVPARWLYDDAGSQLFEDITDVPEYYPTRAEREILESRQQDFARLIGPGRAVVEFGSGSSVKTPLLLGAIDPAAYVPLDIAGDFLRAAAEDLAAKFPGLPVYPVEADFMKPVKLPKEVAELPKLGFFPGSTIGNMVARTAVDLLRSMRETLGDGSKLLIGMDLIKDPDVLIAAYDDSRGITAEFNLNLARRINRELGGTIPVDRLRHVARWNDTFARIEMHLEAQEDLEFEVSGRRFAMQRGETIHTENSHKFDRRSQYTLLLAGGWTPEERWLDSGDRFSLILASASERRNAP
ncbi:dimethylhistidine N-methyltransferase [Altererythrobacter atlanticus]|uniref:Histidine-specific methyltransferase EgtD n=1 Tax=Croceibacterium atlanticum TaxID=1267766 RepID=A0A0F7KTY2_9SPHN|nr:L-histidine N(alpha)-methyltransferase [Croceibacterium atlanticum]AKH42255.1 Histidine-specific methyltransferase EgtD [Croceibacterium atlanticum]MBB5731031.1 dimethylhistidine N-methyltransferase [Croceibacterium atlanticum]